MHAKPPPALAAALLALAACRSGPHVHQPPPAPAEEPALVGEAIVVCGTRVPIGAPVVLWSDPGGYSAYSTQLRFPDEAAGEAPVGLRYAPGRAPRAGGSGAVPADAGPEHLPLLQERVDQLVLHYDAAGTSRRCFQILHDRRKLSAHFLLDLDGTLYQTLDLADTAWHARQANARSVGVEIANVGAYPPGAPSPLDDWYARDERGVRVRLPPGAGDGGVRMRGFVGRPAQPQRVRGTIQGQELEMHDLTPEQHLTLERLAAALARVLPKLRPDAPRHPDGPLRGQVRREALSEADFEAFQGILGHHHVSADKVDPGPAFDWERFLARVRARGARP